MAFRFRKSFKLLPGVRLNVSKSGLSTTVGPRGAKVNFAKDRTTATVGLPGTGLSHTATLSRGSVGQTTTHFVTNDIAFGSSADNQTFASDANETAYRIAALLAAAVLGSADHDEVAIRIVGMLPERLPQKLTGPQAAKALIEVATAPSRTVGVANIRRAMQAVGLQALGAVDDAVAAVRKSNKLRLKVGGDARLPVEWFLDGQTVQQREFEAPSLRARIPHDVLSNAQAAQLEAGQARLADPNLNAPVKLPLGVRIVWRLFQAVVLIVATVFFCVVGYVLAGIYGG